MPIDDELRDDELPHFAHHSSSSPTLAHDVTLGLHASHAGLHTRLLLLVLFLLVASQAALVAWRTRSPRTFRRATLVGAWLAVPCVAMTTHWWLAGALWLAYTLAAARLVRRALHGAAGSRHAA
jgi:hypothetical protein